MADLTVTAGSVVSTGTQGVGTAGGTITAGQVVRLNTSNEVVTASDDSATNAAALGIALNGASSGQPVSYHTAGNINPGATVAVGKVYVVSTSGGIAPIDDVAGGEYITYLGVGTTTSNLSVQIHVSGVAAAGAVA